MTRTGERILVTGAGGKTGHAVISRLLARGARVTALVRRPEQARTLTTRGVERALVAEMEDSAALTRAAAGIDAVYHICPNMHPAETAIGRAMIASAAAGGVERFVFHSVLHPQVEAMPHHWAKLRVEEALFESDLAWTVLQPAPYMQNVMAARESILGEGRYPVPYAPATRVVMVDLEDVAAAAARVLTEPGHEAAVYELCGADLLDQNEIAGLLGEATGREVRALALPRREWRERAAASGLSSYAIETLLAMFRYYENFGMAGSPRVLEWLLGRPPVRFADFVAREAVSEPPRPWGGPRH